MKRSEKFPWKCSFFPPLLPRAAALISTGKYTRRFLFGPKSPQLQCCQQQLPPDCWTRALVGSGYHAPTRTQTRTQTQTRTFSMWDGERGCSSRPCKGWSRGHGWASAKQTVLRDLFFFFSPLSNWPPDSIEQSAVFWFVFGFSLAFFSPPDTVHRAACGMISYDLRQQCTCVLGNSPSTKALPDLLCFVDFSPNSDSPHPDSPGIPAVAIPVKYFCLN